MGVLSFLGILGREAPQVNLQRDFLFEVLLPDMRSANGNNILGTEVGKLCKKASFGNYSLTDVSLLRYGPFTRSFTGFFEIPDLVLDFTVPVKDFIEEYILAWRFLMIDGKGFYLPKNNYSKDVSVRLYDRTGELSSEFKLEGVFPKVFPKFNVSYASEDVLRYTIDFNVDFIRRQPLVIDSDSKSVDGSVTRAFRRTVFS